MPLVLHKPFFAQRAETSRYALFVKLESLVQRWSRFREQDVGVGAVRRNRQSVLREFDLLARVLRLEGWSAPSFELDTDYSGESWF